jgi:hypothetical protein
MSGDDYEFLWSKNDYSNICKISHNLKVTKTFFIYDQWQEGRPGCNSHGTWDLLPTTFSGNHHGPYSWRKVEQQVRVLIKNLAYFPAWSFCRYHSNFNCWKLLPKNRRNKDKSKVLINGLPYKFGA